MSSQIGYIFLRVLLFDEFNTDNPTFLQGVMEAALSGVMFPWTCFPGYSLSHLLLHGTLSTSDSCFQPLEMYFSTPFPENSHDFHIHPFWFMPLAWALSKNNQTWRLTVHAG